MKKKVKRSQKLSKDKQRKTGELKSSELPSRKLSKMETFIDLEKFEEETSNVTSHSFANPEEEHQLEMAPDSREQALAKESESSKTLKKEFTPPPDYLPENISSTRKLTLQEVIEMSRSGGSPNQCSFSDARNKSKFGSLNSIRDRSLGQQKLYQRFRTSKKEESVARGRNFFTESIRKQSHLNVSPQSLTKAGR
jgi:hypothetical protein